MFAVATGDTQIEMQGVTMTVFNPVAFDTLTAIENLHLRISVIKSALARRLRPPLQDEFEALAQELRTRAGERNNVVHAVWGAVDTYPNDILRRIGAGPFASWQRYTEGDLKNIVHRILTTSGNVHTFANKVTTANARPKKKSKPP